MLSTRSLSTPRLNITKKQRLLLYLSLGICCFLFGLVLLYPRQVIAEPEDLQSQFHPGEKAKKAEEEDDFKKIEQLSREVDEEWLPILRRSPIKSITDIDTQTHGLASKWQVVFETGHRAMAKLAEPYRLFEPQWETVTARSATIDERLYARRSGRKLQAWPEVAASAVARIIMPYRKVPIAMRKVSSKEFYSCSNCRGWTNWFKALMPETPVYISVQAWMKKLVTTPPPTDYYKFLAGPESTKATVETMRRVVARKAGLISDTLVFDVLVDDHDRMKGHNWVSDGRDNLLLWDSGLAFNHGPLGRSSCMDLLCGPDKWLEFGEEHFGTNKHTCKRICKFRNSTITHLRGMGPDAPPEKRLSSLLKQEMAKETTKVFELNEYYGIGRYPKVSFITDDFYAGMDLKLGFLLNWVDDCIRNYGEKFVLDTDIDKHNVIPG